MRCEELLADDSSSGTDGDVEALDSSDYGSDHAYETDSSLLEDVVTTCMKLDSAEEIDVAQSLFATSSLNQAFYGKPSPASPVAMKTEVVVSDPLFDIMRGSPSDSMYEYPPLSQPQLFAAPPQHQGMNTLCIGWNGSYTAPDSSYLDHYTDEDTPDEDETTMFKHFPLKHCEELASCAALPVAGPDMESFSPVDVDGMQLTPVHDHDLLDILI